MSVTVILELRFKPESVAAGRDLMRETLKVTRAFEGNLGTEVLADEDDEAHWSSTSSGRRSRPTRPTARFAPAKER
jgi:quinol monooxygenase YgiN